ncbi:unnamed protein product [Trichobilharzia regenti]|nr:unnamed protein product [Trichobilharzia regenti]
MHKAILISCLILQLNTLFTSAQDTDELKTIFEFHNKVRLSALNGEIPNQPKAKQMPELTWNDKLAELAQQHVEKCVLEKSNLDELFVGKYDKVGQAVAEHQSIQKILDTWYDEHKEYKFDQNECASECGTYKQVCFIFPRHTISTVITGTRKTEASNLLNLLCHRDLTHMHIRRV